MSEFLCHYGVKGMKWGVRRYQNKDGSLTTEGKIHYGHIPSVSNTAEEIYNRAYAKEPRITHDVKGSRQHLYGLEHKLKTKESIKRKLEKEISEENKSLAEASKNLKDALRYTTISDTNSFVNNYNNFKKYMEEKGYKEIRCKNDFQNFNEGKVKHKSVQSIFEDTDGYKFEVQFQTPSSQKAKDLKVPLYEERRKVGISSERASELEKQMNDLALAVENPPGIETIKSYDNIKK